MAPSTLLLLRHGLAESPRLGQPDVERRLTPEGRAQVQDLGAGLTAVGFCPDEVMASTYLRAIETAEALTGRPPDSRSQELVPHGSVERAEFLLRAHMAGLESGRCLLAVSHLPLAELLVLRLGGGRCALPPAHGVALSWDGRRFNLLGRLQPQAPFLVRP